MRRRRYLATCTTTLGIAFAGCLSGDATEPTAETEDDDASTHQNGSGSGSFELTGDDALPVAAIGDPDADVTLTVFEDFGCPACAHYNLEVFPEIDGEYVESGEIGYEHRDFPIPAQEPWSWDVASAARSVQDRAGDDAFFAFAEAMYAAQRGGYSYDVIESAAADLAAAVDPEQVRADAEEGRYREELEIERQRAIDAGLQGTPTTVVDGEVVEPSIDALTTAIDGALDGSGGNDSIGDERA